MLSDREQTCEQEGAGDCVPTATSVERWSDTSKAGREASFSGMPEGSRLGAQSRGGVTPLVSWVRSGFVQGFQCLPLQILVIQG